MQILKLRLVLGAFLAISTAVFAETLTFIPQRDLDGILNNSWSGVDNWFIENAEDPEGELVRAGRLPREDDTAVLRGTVDAGAMPIRMRLIIVSNEVSILNGYFALENVHLLGGNTLSNSTISLLGIMAVRGENCRFKHVTLKILSTGTLHFDPVQPGFATSLDLGEETLIDNGGQVLLTDNALLTGGGLPESQVVIHAGTTLAASGIAVIRGSTNGPLVIDNSGTIRAENGNLGLEGGIDWQCSAGVGRFHATDAASSLDFESPFQVANPTTSIFTGLGTCRWKAGGTLDGVALVGDGSQTGNAEILNSIEGTGTLRIVGGGPPGGVVDWINGSVGLPKLEIDAGGTLNVAGTDGTRRHLAGCTVRNSGSCVVQGPGLEFGESAHIINDATGLFETTTESAFTSARTEDTTFDNAGTFRHSAPGVMRFGDAASVAGPDFNNTGVVEVRRGELRLLGGVSNGEFVTAEEGGLWFWGGQHTLGAGANFSGEGKVRLSQGATAPTWVVTGPIQVSDLEAGANSILQGQVGSTNQIRVGTLSVSSGAAINDGRFVIDTLNIQGGTTFKKSIVTVLDAMSATGTNCGLDGATLNLMPGAVATIASGSPGTGASLSLDNGALLRCQGRVLLADGTRLTANGSATPKLEIQSGGLIESSGACFIGGSTQTLAIDNSSIFLNASGTLQFGGAINWECGSGTGVFETATPEAVTSFSSPFYVEAATTAIFSGPGLARLQAGAVVDGGVQVGAVDQKAGTFVPGTVEVESNVAGAGGINVAGTSTNGSALLWSRGTLSLARVDIASGGRMVVAGASAAPRVLSRVALSNFGLVLLEGDGLTLENNCTVNNHAPGTVELQSDCAIAGLAAPNGGSFNNAGTLMKTIGGVARIGSVGSEAGVGFKNTGSLQVKTGRLAFSGAWLQASGSTMVDAGAVLQAGLLKLQGGTITGTGTLEGNIENGGIVNPGASPGALTTGVGQDYTQLSTGALVIDLGGNAPGTSHDQLRVGGKATLNGRIEVRLLNGFAPKPGDSFTILTANSLVGTFPLVVATDSNTLWVPRYSNTSVTLTAASPTGLTAPHFSGGSWTLPFQTTPGFAYVVQKTVSLEAPDWRTLANIEGDGTLRTVTDPDSGPQAFYRILMQ